MQISKLTRTITLAASLLVSGFSFAANIDMNADANDVAIKGFDTVAYFTQGKPVEGYKLYTATYNNAIYQFASAENRDMFRANPEKYAPQYGGFCAMGVALERKFDIDPTAFEIINGKLYLNLNPAVQKKWLTDTSGYINTAQRNWPEIKTKTDAELSAD